SFANANLPGTAVTGLTVGTNTFVWTISDNNGICSPNSDTVSIIVEEITVANAGADQNVCVDNAILAANAVAAGEAGTWTVTSGTGVFADANDPTTTVSGLSAGENIFVWTISNAAST